MDKINGETILKGKIGILSLSSPAHPKKWNAAINFLKNKGIKFSTPLNPTNNYGSPLTFSTHSVKQRVNAFHKMLKSRSINTIVPARGGYGAIALLNHLNPNLIKNKPLLGFSDFTYILLYAFKFGNKQLLYAPNVLSFASKEKNILFNDLYNFKIVKNTPLFPNHNIYSLANKNKTAKGKLIGGTLSCITTLIGTKYLPSFKDAILFIEDTGEAPYKIDKMLRHLALAGIFAKVKGVIIGDFTNCKHPKDCPPSTEEVFYNFFKQSTIPVVAGAPFGHHNKFIPVPIGAKVTLNKNEIIFC